MKAVTDLIKRFQRGYTDVVGVDVGSTAVKAVRVKMVNRTPTVVAADLLPPLPVPIASEAPVRPLVLPLDLQARYVALAYSDPAAIVKILTFPARSDKAVAAQVSELLGLGESTDQRVAYEALAESRNETRVLAVALPDVAGSRLCALFPSGTPAPCSVEIAGLAGMTAFERGAGQRHAEEAVALIDFGALVTTVSFYHKGVLVLMRKLDVGTAALLKKVQATLGVDAEVALGIMTEGSFDISSALHQTLESFLQQLIISRDFVERRENCHVTRLYTCGGIATHEGWAGELRTATGLEPERWNPFADVAVGSNALSAAVPGQESRFAAALGAACGVLSGA